MLKKVAQLEVPEASRGKRRARLASVSSIVARSYEGRFIGIDNQLPWHLSTDLQHFKATTNGKAVIMGRKTFESIGRPLPNRYNIVLSRIKGDDKKNLVWANSIESALYFADIYSISNLQEEIFIVGGSQMYSEFSEFINKIYLTEVFCGLINGDAVFDHNFDQIKWKIKSEQDYPKTDKDQYPFRITIMRKRKPIHRYEFIEKFLDPSGERREWRRRAIEALDEKAASEFDLKAEQFAFKFCEETQIDDLA